MSSYKKVISFVLTLAIVMGMVFVPSSRVTYVEEAYAGLPNDQVLTYSALENGYLPSGSYYLDADTDWPCNIKIASDATVNIDLCGQNITFKNNAQIRIEGGELNISNGSIKYEGSLFSCGSYFDAAAASTKAGILTLSDLSCSGTSVFINSYNCEIVLNNVKSENDKADYDFGIALHASTLSAFGGTEIIQLSSNGTGCGSVSLRDSSVMLATDASIKANSCDEAIYLENGSRLVLSENTGVYSSKTAIFARTNSVIENYGGVLESKFEQAEIKDCVIEIKEGTDLVLGSGASISYTTGVGIFIDSDDSNYDDCRIELTDDYKMPASKISVYLERDEADTTVEGITYNEELDINKYFDIVSHDGDYYFIAEDTSGHAIFKIFAIEDQPTVTNRKFTTNYSGNETVEYQWYKAVPTTKAFTADDLDIVASSGVINNGLDWNFTEGRIFFNVLSEDNALYKDLYFEKGTTFSAFARYTNRYELSFIAKKAFSVKVYSNGAVQTVESVKYDMPGKEADLYLISLTDIDKSYYCVLEQPLYLYGPMYVTATYSIEYGTENEQATTKLSGTTRISGTKYELTVLPSETGATLSSAEDGCYYLCKASLGGIVLTSDIMYFTSLDAHNHTDGKSFTAAISNASELESLFTNGGSGYLTKDIDLTEAIDNAITVAKDASLCLNGYTLNLGGSDLTNYYFSGPRMITIEDGVTFNIYDHDDSGKICGGFNNLYDGHGGAFDVYGTLNMYGGTITGCRGGYGGSVHVESTGIFNMYGGTITESTARYGGAVYNRGTFNMYGGIITDSKATDGEGGGVYNSEGTFNMLGGSIENCDAYSWGGGVSNEGTFNLSGASISYCTAGRREGGGVYNGGVFVMESGSIHNCTAEATNGWGGGGVEDCGTFYMYDGEIYDCFAYGGGGGVMAKGKFLMYGGTIRNCTATENGGGVNCVYGVFHMFGGELKDNLAGEDGGGVYNGVAMYSFHMHGGLISSNAALGYGGGVCIYSDDCSFDGNCVVKNNYAYMDADVLSEENRVRNNVYISNYSSWGDGNYLHIGSDRTPDAHMGDAAQVWVSVSDTDSAFVKTDNEDDKQHFISDIDAYYVEYNAYDNALYLESRIVTQPVLKNGYTISVLTRSGAESLEEEVVVTGYQWQQNHHRDVAAENIVAGKSAYAPTTVAGDHYDSTDESFEFFGRDFSIEHITVAFKCTDGEPCSVSFVCSNESISLVNINSYNDVSMGDEDTYYPEIEQIADGEYQFSIVNTDGSPFTIGAIEIDVRTDVPGATEKTISGAGVNGQYYLCKVTYKDGSEDYSEETLYTLTHEHNDETFTVEIKDAENLEALFTGGGLGYLSCNITVDKDLIVESNASLCLNGYTLNLSGQSIKVNKNVEFNLHDCCGDGAVINGYAPEGGSFYVIGTMNMYGGTIRQSLAGEAGGAVYVEKNAFNMYGGVITDCLSGNGGAVFAQNGSFHMYGGTIVSNAAIYGGGVYNASNLFSFHMHGGTITRNFAGVSGGGVYNKKDADMSLDGPCVVENNHSYGTDSAIEWTDENKTVDNVYAEEEFVIGNAFGAEDLSDGSRIGVNVSSDILNRGDLTGVFAYWAMPTDLDGFSSDDPEYIVKYACETPLIKDTGYLYLTKAAVYTTEFDALGGTDAFTGTTYDAITTYEGVKINLAKYIPQRDKYSRFNGWYIGNTKLDSVYTVSGDAIITARWLVDQTVSTEGSVVDNPYNDADSWTRVRVSSGSIDVQACGLETIAKEEKSAATDKSIRLVLSAEETAEASVSPEAVTAIRSSAGSRTVNYLDIDLTKYMYVSTASVWSEDNVSSITDTGMNVIEVLIPFEADGKENIEIYHYHGDSVRKFEKQTAENYTGEDGTFYIENNVIHLFTTKFSTYAIGYTVPSPAVYEDSSSPEFTVPVHGDKTKNVPIKAKVDGDTATVNEITKKDIEKAGTGDVITIDLSGLPKNIDQVIIPKATLKNISDSGAGGLEVRFPSGVNVSADQALVSTLYDEDSSIRLVVDRDTKAEKTLTAAQKKTVETLHDPVVLDAYFIVTSTGKRLADFKGGKADITAEYKTKNLVRVWYIPDDGSKELVPSKCDGEKAEFAVTHFSHYVIENLETGTYSDCPQDETCVYYPFTDANTKAWYHPGVHFCVELGYMNGTAYQIFEPMTSLSRAMIATMIWRLEGSPEVSYDMTFTDVPAESWYTDAVKWAQSVGVVEGYDDYTFGPHNDVTREQLAAILMRYAQYKGIDVTNLADITAFSDSTAVSDWAYNNVRWANAVGIITGRDNNEIAPLDSTTRAEAANMFQRFCTMFSR